VSNTAAQSKKRTAWPLFAILAITVLPIVAAYVAFFTGVGVPDETVNEGELVVPAKNVETILADAAGEIPGFKDNLNWRVLIPVPDYCDETCQRNLYITRQVHIRLAEKGERLERFAVNIGGAEGERFLDSIKDEQPGLKRFTVQQEVWEEWLHDSNVSGNLRGDHYYLLVDQVGFAMMFYTTRQDGNQLLKDLKRVLRFSPGG
jgi:hypothetical protein